MGRTTATRLWRLAACVRFRYAVKRWETVVSLLRCFSLASRRGQRRLAISSPMMDGAAASLAAPLGRGNTHSVSYDWQRKRKNHRRRHERRRRRRLPCWPNDRVARQRRNAVVYLLQLWSEEERSTSDTCPYKSWVFDSRRNCTTKRNCVQPSYRVREIKPIGEQLKLDEN